MFFSNVNLRPYTPEEEFEAARTTVVFTSPGQMEGGMMAAEAAAPMPAAMVGRRKLDPGLKATGFSKFECAKGYNSAFNLKPLFV